jgi:curved DNA-binding protein
MDADSEVYALLGVSRGCTKAQLSKAKKKLAEEWHPDRNNQSEESQEMMKKINAAFDRVYHLEFEPQPQEPIFSTTSNNESGDAPDLKQFETLGKMSEGAFFKASSSRHAKTSEIEVTVTLEELFSGTKRKYEGKTKNIIELLIPAGTLPGEVLSAGGRKFRTVLNSIRTQDHRFNISNGCLSVIIPLEAKEALLWEGDWKFEHIDGNEVAISIPPPLDTARSYVIEGQGFPRKDGSRGSLIVRFEVSFPNLTDEQKQTLRSMFQ